MKLISIILWHVFLFTSCNCVKNSKSNVIASNIETIPQEQIISFEYVASARSSYQKILITKNKALITKKRGANFTGTSLNIEGWNALTEFLKEINLEELSVLEAPSKDFQFDGAAITRLKVISNGKTYETPPFDHGNPPKEIEALVKEILSISENIE